MVWTTMICNKCEGNNLRWWPLTPVGLLGFLFRTKGGIGEFPPPRKQTIVLVRCPGCGHKGIMNCRSEF